MARSTVKKSVRVPAEDKNKAILKAQRKWENEEVAKRLKRFPELKSEFVTSSGIPIKRLYTPVDAAVNYLDDLSFPGEYPYTRGVDATGYRARHGTRRPITGFQSAEETIYGFTI